jgi:CelD/BcsL family acetyltransferase involved in cellulose biosynthesis
MQYTAKLVATDEELRAVLPEWSDLYSRAEEKMAAQHPAYFNAARKILTPGSSLAVVTVHASETLVGLWPLSLTKRGGCRVAGHPTAGSNEEYAGMLIDPHVDSAAAVVTAIAEIRTHADLIAAYNIRPNSPILPALRQASLAISFVNATSYVVDLAHIDTWERWLKSKSKNFRQNLGGQRRNLVKLGNLQSIEDEFEIIEWFFKEKRKWLAETHRRSSWVSNPDLGEKFFKSLARQPDTPLKIFALKMDGAYIAANICVISDPRLEVIATVHATDGTLERFSPGMLVSEDCGRWALKHGLDLDFRFTYTPYKGRWMSRTDAIVSVKSAVSPHGLMEVYAAIARNSFRKLRQRASKTARALGVWKGREAWRSNRRRAARCRT